MNEIKNVAHRVAGCSQLLAPRYSRRAGAAGSAREAIWRSHNHVDAIQSTKLTMRYSPPPFALQQRRSTGLTGAARPRRYGKGWRCRAGAQRPLRPCHSPARRGSLRRPPRRRSRSRKPRTISRVHTCSYLLLMWRDSESDYCKSVLKRKSEIR